MTDVCIMAPTSERLNRLRSVLKESSVRVAGMATTFPLLRSLVTETSPDMVLIEWESLVEDAAARDWLLEFLDHVPVILFSREAHQAVLNGILHAGAGGVLRMDAPLDQILLALESVAAGLVVVDGAVVTQRFDGEIPVDELTPRESEVLGLLADGLGNKEIAMRLNVSEHTIKFHIRSILGKLGAASRTKAVSRGFRHGLIEM